jgi:hypothetical protein
MQIRWALRPIKEINTKSLNSKPLLKIAKLLYLMLAVARFSLYIPYCTYTVNCTMLNFVRFPHRFPIALIPNPNILYSTVEYCVQYIVSPTVKKNKPDAGSQHVGAGKFRHPRRSGGPIYVTDFYDLSTWMLCSCVTLGFCNSASLFFRAPSSLIV